MMVSTSAKHEKLSNQSLLFDLTVIEVKPHSGKKCAFPGCTNPVVGRGKWCSANCRSKASYHRRRNEGRLPQRIASIQDITAIRRFSEEAADCLIQVRDVAGHEVGDIALDAVWALLVALNVDLDAIKR
jgi:predicted nucleic acid-binding Zn ribbon protein